MSTFYDTLGLSRDATEEAIKKAYRDLQLKHHPDKTKHLPQQARTESETISKAVNVAYETLSDARARQKYDNTLPPTLQPPQTSPMRGSRTSPQTPRSNPPSQSSPLPRPRTPPQPRPRSQRPTCPTSTPQQRGRPVPLITRITSGTANGWTWTITIAGRFIPTDLTTASIKVRSDHISITTKLRRQMSSGKPDVHVLITKAEGSQRVEKLESLYKVRKGREYGDIGWNHELSVSFACVPSSRTTLSAAETLTYGWNLETDMHPNAPRASIIFAHCSSFHRNLENANAIPDSISGHRYGHGPKTVLQSDSDLGQCGSKGRFVLEDMQGEEEGWVTWNGVKMLRRAALGWVEKDEEDKKDEKIGGGKSFL